MGEKDLSIDIDLVASIKGRPSGVFAKMPSWLIRWFTWRETEIGHVKSTVKYPLRVKAEYVKNGDLSVSVDEFGNWLGLTAGGVGFDNVELDLEGAQAVNVYAYGVRVKGTVTLKYA